MAAIFLLAPSSRGKSGSSTTEIATVHSVKITELFFHEILSFVRLIMELYCTVN